MRKKVDVIDTPNSSLEELKITQLYVAKKHVKAHRNADGTITRTPTRVRVKRKIQEKGGVTRVVHSFIDSTILIAINFGIILLAGGAPDFLQYVPIEVVVPVPMFIYYFVFEFALQTSPGKLLSNSIVIDEYGNKPTAGTIALRSALRLIPFDGLTFFLLDRGWHDQYSKTYVVSRKEAKALLKLKENQKEILKIPRNIPKG